MGKFKYEENELRFIENSTIPFAVFQYCENKIMTVAVTAGLCKLFNNDDMKSVYELLDNNMYRDVHPDDVARISDAALRFATEEKTYDVIFRLKSHGSYRVIHAKGEHIYEKGARLAFVCYFDEGDFIEKIGDENFSLNYLYSKVLKETSATQKIQYDFLTGLPSMSYFFELVDANLKKMLEKNERPVMLFCDLNGMKYFNMKYGFSAGDALIRAFSRELVDFFGNDHCCRFGMDRFCVYTNDENLEERLWTFFAKCEDMNGGRALPVRVGIYSSKLGIIGPSYACERAKMACDAGKNIYLSHFTYFDERMIRLSENRQYIIDNFDRALKEKWIQVFYQPIVRSANGNVCDEEALARWFDPEKGMLSPADFIPVLEEANLIYKLDLYVTEQVLEKMKAQAEKGLYVVPISINLSRSDFDTCDIVSEIKKRLDASGVPPEKITIEITESVIGSSYEYMQSQVERFQKLGFKVWMDDFGSGYSSLNVLQTFNFDLIKLDMKFMQQFYKSDKTKIILSGLIKMAGGLGIETVCEGVETPEQIEFLKEIGCTKMQGYYFCKPISKDDVFARYDKGIQIGFENPCESDYYERIGKLNLYDLSVITDGAKESFSDYFNTLPMAIFEEKDMDIMFLRGNKSYKEFLRKNFSSWEKNHEVDFKSALKSGGQAFMDAIQKCKESLSPIIIDESLIDGTLHHLYLRKIASNPIKKVTAIIVVILGKR
ncbi:MAG: EAL domain-containing protein [Treponema sp.]|nr:EAL domain-containing protein [Treponema sp.]